MRDPISHDARSYREAPSETQNEPPPPPPSEAPDAWAEVEEVLRNELRIFTATKCVAEMRRRGESVDDALKAIEEFREGMRSERFQNEGALQGRLVNGLWPDDRQRREAEEKRRRARRKQEHLQASLAAYAAGEDRRPNEKPVAAAMEKFIPTESWIPPDKRRSPG